MASSDNTALKVSLVVLGVITLGVLVAFIMQLEKVDELGKQADLAKNEAAAAKKETGDVKAQYAELRELIAGAGKNNDDHKALKDSLDKLLTTPQLSPERIVRTRGRYQTLEDAVKLLQNELTAADKVVADGQKKSNELENILKKSRDEVNKEIAQIQAKLDAATEDLKKEQMGFKSKIDEKDRSILTIQNQLSSTRADMEQMQRDLAAKTKSFDTTVARMSLNLQQLKTENSKLNTVIFGSKESGRIQSVEEGGLVANVNVGAADGLRTGQIFGVYGKDTGGNPLELPKASLEIYKIVGPHTAKGRISGYKVEHPILDNDLIYSAIWSPGSYEGIALSGLIYMDDDNQHDLEEFKKLVTRNGGKVDAYIDPKTGKIVGEITPKTRWLVLGNPMEMVEGAPEDESDIKRRAEFSKSITDLKKAAANNGVAMINMENFKTYIGYNAPYNSIPVGQEKRMLERRGYVPPKGQFESMEKKSDKSKSGSSGR